MKKHHHILCLLAFFFLLSNLAEARKSKIVQIEEEPAASQEFWKSDLEEVPSTEPFAVGVVSWYGPGFHGHKTASGERYNMHEHTCASRDLPFGTLLEITNLKNGEKAVVRVNDRGPFVRTRILDVSYAVARKLGFIGSGFTKAEIRKVTP